MNECFGREVLARQMELDGRYRCIGDTRTPGFERQERPMSGPTRKKPQWLGQDQLAVVHCPMCQPS